MNHLKSFMLKLHIRSKIMLIFLATFIPILCAIIIATNWISNDYSRNIMVKNNQLILKNTAEQSDGILRDMERIALLTVSDQDLQRIMESYNGDYDYTYWVNQNWMNDFFLNLITIRDSVFAIRIVKANDIVYEYNVNNYLFKKPYNYEGTPWVRSCKQYNGKTVLLGTAPIDDIVFFNSCDKTTSSGISVARQINKTLSEKCLGYIKIDTNLGVIESVINQYKSKDSRIIISDRDGNIVYNNNYDYIGKKIDTILDTKPILASKENYVTRTINHQNYIITYLTSDYSGWTTYCLTPETAVNSGLKSIEKITWLIVIFGIAIAVVLSALLSKAVSKNIVSLNKSMKLVQEGNFNIHLSPQSDDEIGELTITFNSMIRYINDLIQQEYLSQIKNQELQINQKQTELQVLLSQVNPHFLYNSLDVISINAALNGDPATEKMLITLSRFYRMTLSNPAVKSTLKNELDIVEAYIQICRYRFRHVDITVADTIEDPDKYAVPSFILQPIVENAINHGMETEDEKCIIIITTERLDSYLQISISDNGRSMSADKMETLNQSFREQAASVNEGIGLKNVNRRIALICGSEYGLQLKQNQGHGLTVIVKLPVLF